MWGDIIPVLIGIVAAVLGYTFKGLFEGKIVRGSKVVEAEHRAQLALTAQKAEDDAKLVEANAKNRELQAEVEKLSTALDVKNQALAVMEKTAERQQIVEEVLNHVLTAVGQGATVKAGEQ